MEVNLLEMTTIHDCSMNSVHANEGYRHCLRRQFDLNSISNTVKILHTIWHTRSWLILSTGCWDIKQVKSVCNPSSLKIKSCPGQAPASGKVTAEPRRTWSCAWAACAGSFRGEVVEAGEVSGSERMTTLPCNLGSYDSWPSLNLIRRINLQK